jgi:hypothetical protein
MKNTLLSIIFIVLNLTSTSKSEALLSIKNIKVEKGKIYHCDVVASKKILAHPPTSFKCELMRKDPRRQAPFEYVTTKKIVNLYCPKKLFIFSNPQYDEGYIYKYLVTCNEPQGED